MKSFVLLILSLMAGCKATSEVKGCTDGWVVFSCKYKTYENISVVTPTQGTILSTQEDVWQDLGRFSVYHNTLTNKVKVAIRNIQPEDSGEYKCKFHKESDSNDDKDENKSQSKEANEESKSDSKEDKKGNKSDHDDDVEVEIKVDDSCQRPFIQTAYRTAKTTITCVYNPNQDSTVKFFCKDNGSVCEDVLSTKSLKSNGTFTLTETNRGFNVSISNVSSQHAGVYWCGAKSKEGSYRYALRKIQLMVEDITNFTRSPTIGQNLTYYCGYPKDVYIMKFICKGEDPSLCEPLVSTLPNKINTQKFSIQENRPKRNITVTVKNISTEDAGTYWCGAELVSSTRLFFHKLKMTVEPLTAPSSDDSWIFPVSAVVLTCVALLVLILVLIYKRFQQPKIIGEAQKNEDRAYAEIQRPQEPGSGIAPKTIYVTAKAPTNPSAPPYYSPVNFHNSSEGVGGGNGQCPVYSTVNPAFRPSEDPFYSTVSIPQQQ